ncbi:syntaxin binding protein 1 [Vanrija albida]|uniref:Syntaxin binding protein 1 n=1 Tax=Vanrija albida TaxID=181172 RepID=A0ABR3QCY7_9TREE
MVLKDLLKARFTTAIQSIPAGTWKVLITDKWSQTLLDSVYTQYDILQQNVTSVEPLHSPRQPMQVEGLYLLTPTAQNVDRVIADFVGRKTYNSAHVYFTDGIDDSLAQRLTDGLGPSGVLRAFVELYCNFYAAEQRVFSMQTPSSFYSMFGNLGGVAAADLSIEAFYDDLKVTSRTILNVLTTINENPYIRYYQPSHHAPLGPLVNQPSASSSVSTPSGQPAGQSNRWRAAMGGSGRGTPEVIGDYLPKKIAVQVQNDLDEYMANNPEFPIKSERPRGMLFVVDRSIDPVAPFLHEFWYQAMANDLLKIEDGIRYRYTYENTVGGKEDKEAILDDDDKVWVSVRHLHMKDAIDHLMTDFGRFAQEHAGFRGNANNVSIDVLKDMLADLPQFQTQREQFSLHLEMAQKCMDLFQKNKLNLAANVEQCCATGFTPDGKQPKSIVEEMVPLLDDRTMSNLDKVRVIALYIMFRDGVADEDRRRLYQHARLSLSEQDMVNNLIYLGVTVVKDSKTRVRGSRIKQKYTNTDDQFDLSRYKPVVQIMVEEQVANRLDQHQFPFMRDTPAELSQSLRGGHSQAAAVNGGTSLRSARPTWHKAPSARAANSDSKQRLVIFVAGGVTYSELRQAYVLSKALGKDIYIGSTHIVTPEAFMKDLRSLGRGGIAGNPPNPIPIHPQAPVRIDRQPGQAVPYQRILDYRHWVAPVPPPTLAPPTPASAISHKSSSTMRPSGSNSNNDLSGGFSQLSVSSKDSKSSRKDGEKKKKESLFKLKWGKD